MSVEEASERDFSEKVLARSAERPVVVDFWAPWCAPCRVLGPVLEAEVGALGGRVQMVKVNTDESPSLAAQFNIQGIPAVKAFRDGRVVAEFVGARPVPFVRHWLAGLAPSPAVASLAAATAAAQEGKRAEAEAALRPLLDDPEVRDQARVSLARLLLEAGRASEVPPLLTGIDPRSPAADALPALERLLAFADEASAAGGEDKARAQVESDPRDLEARYDLASALAARGDFAGALEQFLEVVSRNRKFRDEGARLAMLAIFDLLGNDHDLTQDFRRRLQIVL
jgi:putative thioredoxin